MKLEELISVLSSEEQVNFLSYLNNVNKRKDAKNKELFQLLLKGFSSKEIPRKLYGEDNKRAYHALRIRLQKNIIDYLGQEGLQSEALEEVSIYKLVFLGRKFLQKQHYEIGMEFLLLAKEKAENVQHYVLLNEIFHSMVQYSYASEKVDVHETIEIHAQNATFLIQEERLNVVYALIQNKLKSHLYQRDTEIPDNLISSLIAEYKLELGSFTTFKALFQYIKILLAVAQAKNNYYGFIEQIISQYNVVTRLKEDSDRQLFYHVRLLYSISNTFFRIKEFEKCEKYISILQELLSDPKFPYKERFQVKFNILASLNANYSGRNQEAIDIVESINLKRIQNYKDKYDLTFCYILFSIHSGDLQKAKKIFNGLFHTDRYYEDRMGIDWLLKLKLIEIILYFEIGDDDLIESRIRSYKRAFFNYLTEQKQDRVINFVKLVEKMFTHPNFITTEEFSSIVTKSIAGDPSRNEDVFDQSYYGWMKAKMLKRDIYEVTLELAR